MIIPHEFYNQLKQQVRLSDVVRQKVHLVKKSGVYMGLCPFHSEKTASFKVDDIKKFYHCFGCGVGGDVIKFVSETSGLSYRESAIKIASDNGIELPKLTPAQKKEYEEADQIYNILELAAEYFARGLSNEALEYLEKRGIDEKIRAEWMIGYTHKKGDLIKFFDEKSIPLKDLLNSGLVGKQDDDRIYELFTNRIMFPIRNIYNKIVGFGGRTLGDAMPKYLNSPETLVFKKSETMYGENIATSASYKKNYSIIVEGYMDVIALHKAGIKEAMASLGTSVTDKHLQKIWRSCREVIVCLDGDSAGQKASRKLISASLPHIAYDKKISFVRLPNSKDPDDVIKLGGEDLFNKLLANRIDLSKAIWLEEYEGKMFSSAESRANLEQNLTNYCNQISDKNLSNNFRRYFKEQIWQNLYNRKNFSNKQASKSYIINNIDKQPTEMEVIEQSLCSFMIKFPNILTTSPTREFIADLVLSSEELAEFKDWLTGQLDEIDDINGEKVLELVKNTRFYDSFLVLSDPKKMYLDMTFVEKNRDNLEQIFDLLSKKHYLLSLKQEYINLMSNITEDSKLRSSFFIKEIQETLKEIGEMNESLVE